MIILDNEDDQVPSPTKGRVSESPRLLNQARDTEDSMTEVVSESRRDEPPPPPYTDEGQPLLSTGKPGKRARRRFAKAFGMALLMFLGCGICFNVMLFDFKHFHDHTRTPKAPPVPSPTNPGFSEKVIQCIELSDSTPTTVASPGNSEATKGTIRIGAANFYLPSKAESLFFISDGSVIGQIVVSPESDDSEAVHVEVLRTSRLDDPPPVHICVLERKDGSVGIGILNPKPEFETPDIQVNYVFVLKFPATKKYPRQYKSFDIAGPFITNVFADMDGTVDFENVSINSRNASTYVGSLYADRINITHTGGSISGSMRASSLVALSSSEELITVNIDLHGGDEGTPTRLSMSNLNNALHANIRLSPQRMCEQEPHSRIAIPTSPPRPRPMPSLPPPVKSEYAVASPHRLTAHPTTASSSKPISSSAPTSCSPPSFLIDASSDIGLILNLISPPHPPSTSIHSDANRAPTYNLTPLLTLSAIATFGSATLTLPATYEGSYDVRGRLAVIIDDSPEDPSGKGRTRTFQQLDRENYYSYPIALPKTGEGSMAGGMTGKTSDRAIGRVWWGKEPSEVAGRSKVSVRATRMAYLHFGE